MQFTKIIAAVFVATAVAAPTGDGTTPPPATGDCTVGNSEGSTLCCKTPGLLNLLSCVVGICADVGGQNAICCKTDQV